ncbi:hypothetical protein XBI1_2740060 [Xenorhabdus bovienii str. Intermedium]|uniref:Uncharacterized protein n=1 Tax=Xenorhabdus bovienii str. Intermedium TaxID=1379677 RepID=A0A077QBV4_XENBV|nr:hypothetical protein XBI1_2740060 [Xenorhabdus bovienii str. Intermedium]
MRKLFPPMSITHHLFLYLKLSRLGNSFCSSIGLSKFFSFNSLYVVIIAFVSFGKSRTALSNGSLEITCMSSTLFTLCKHYSIEHYRLQYVNLKKLFIYSAIHVLVLLRRTLGLLPVVPIATANPLFDQSGTYEPPAINGDPPTPTLSPTKDFWIN